MYVCIHCGHEFDEPSNRYNTRWSDSDDSEPCCPNCGSPDIEEAEKCIECGAVKPEGETIFGFCEDCLDRAADDFDTVQAYGADRTEAVEINGLYAWAMSKDEIELACLSWMMAHRDPKKDARAFALDDKYDYAGWLKERKTK